MRVSHALSGLLALTLLPALSVPASGQNADPPGDIPFESYRLDNGLHVILAPDPGSTAVAVNLWYDVGSRHERPGRSGFAHLFEHLMFQGSEHVAAGDHFQFVERAGGESNASITHDRTNYFQTLPPERMNLALWLEADRMRSLRITEESMKREVEVVKEERRLRIDNSPYGTTQLEAYYYAAYEPASCFPYGHSVIGSMEDLDAAELSDVQDFFDLHYAPNNATLTIVGDFEPEVARELIQEYFGAIPPGGERPEVACEDPFSHLPVEMTVRDPNATLPAVWTSYGTVPTAHPDAPALNVLARVLGAGQSSRLHVRLVREEQAALQTSSFSDTRLGPGLLIVLAIANQEVQSDRLLQLIDEEVERIREDGITERELVRARSQVRAQVIMGRQTVHGRAEALQSANHFHGDPAAIRTSVERVEAVTAEDVRRVAREYLGPDNRAVIFTRPGSDPEEDR
jgi:predicted Zn-dependent peptidase